MIQQLTPAAAIALLSWPLVALWLYLTRPIGQAILWTILGGYMLLPVGAEIKIPMIPGLNKEFIPSLAAFFGCMFFSRKPVRFSNGFGLAEILMLLLLVSPFITSELNGDQVTSGAVTSPGVGTYDAGSAIVNQIVILLPFLIGRQILRNGPDTEEILRVLVVSGLAYSLPMFFEIRISPQLHTWIYGYFPHAMFDQQIRDGGFRPVVFMGHGLLTAFFTMTAVLASAAFWRTGVQAIRWARVPSPSITVYLSALLVLCKTLNVLIYGVFIAPLIGFTKPRTQVRVAMLLVSLALLYPTLRATDLVPTKALLDMSGSVSPARRDSLQVRFSNEDLLLQRAAQRFWFGWGRFGRSLIYNKSGNVVTRTDGRWIITMGQFGFIGFLAEFGLLSFPVLRAASLLRLAPSDKDKLFLATLALILATNIFDLLPNSPLNNWTWLIAGALLGRAEALLAYAKQQRALSRSDLSPVSTPC